MALILVVVAIAAGALALYFAHSVGVGDALAEVRGNAHERPEWPMDKVAAFLLLIVALGAALAV